MISAAIALVMQIVKWLFGGRQQAEGVDQGKAEQALDDINQELINEQKAQAARARAALSSGIVLDDPNNQGPVFRG